VTRITRARPQHAERPAIEHAGSHHNEPNSAFVSWESLGLDRAANGVPHATIGNVALVLTRHPDLKQKIWLDTFRGRIYHALRGSRLPWTDADELRLTAWFNQSLQLAKFSLELIRHGVQLVAHNNARNSVTEWLNSLTWDGTSRLEDWLSDCLGVPKTPFTIAIARNWLVSMVARAFRPGCQADHMPVLEGSSGAGKSSALVILGGEWYRAAPQAFGSKEFLEAIQGSWLVEIPDMVGFGRREHSDIISAITTRSDVYRASYGRNAEEHPRVTIFAATSETGEYLSDSRGKRRYWPLVCSEINLETLARNRDQLFAEATYAFHNGATWHEVPADEASIEQSAREEQDVWLERIRDFLGNRNAATIAEIAQQALYIEVGKQCHSDKKRIAKCLQQLGFSVKVERDGNTTLRRYRR